MLAMLFDLSSFVHAREVAFEVHVSHSKSVSVFPAILSLKTLMWALFRLCPCETIYEMCMMPTCTTSTSGDQVPHVHVSFCDLHFSFEVTVAFS